MPRKARDNPVNAPASELHTGDIAPPVLPSVALPGSADFGPAESIVLAEPQQVTSDYASELAFMEEPITIRIEPSDEENAPQVVDCWVNGKGAEILDPRTGKWLEINCLPIGGIITTKRKYVEVIARSKVERMKTRHANTGWDGDTNDTNRIDRSVTRKANFSVVKDANPKGAMWLTRLMSER